MIALVIHNAKEAEVDTAKRTLEKIKQYLKGIPGDVTVRITIEPREPVRPISEPKVSKKQGSKGGSH